ncbi:MAG: hypothetical protein KBD16_03240 [Candidatus Pacebacteria bacterium]|nr:hypothetical protein [Candidatus Paceibacterota bacterium]
MQDLVSQSERRSVRNISIDRPQTSGDSTSESVFSKDSGSSFPQRPSFMRSRGRGSKLPWIIGGIVVAIIIVFVLGTLFAGATVTLTPRQALVNLDTTFTAYQTPAAGSVGFEIVSVEKQATRSVTATGEERIERPASGTIIIYNNYDEETQKLIKNTRFQTPEGKIYRIQESITVPGKHKDAEGNMVPGSIEATVFADSAGEAYNIGLSDFTIPGFKEGNDPRYDGFYARSKTEMTGGFSGTVKTASAEDTEKAENEMEAELSSALLEEARISLPGEFVLMPESAEYSFETLPNVTGTDGMVILTSKGVIRLLAINKDAIAQAAALERVSGYAGEPVTFANTEELAFEIVTDPFDLASASSTDIRVTGPTTLVWTFDTEAIAGELAGKARSATAAIFSKYPGIEKADVVVRPFWKRSLPTESADITVAVEQVNE